MSRFRLFGRAAGSPEPAPWAEAGSPWTSLGPAGGPATAGARPAQPGWASPADPPTDPHGFPAVAAAPAAIPAQPARVDAAPAAVGGGPVGAIPVGAIPAGTGASFGPLPPTGTDAPVAAGGVLGSAAPAGPANPDDTRPGRTEPDPAASGAPWTAATPAPWADIPAIGLDPAEAGALAAAFAADYLSWDQDDPGRRSQVLAEYLPDGPAAPPRLGWSGHGRQRADISLPGQVRPDGDGRVLVDVRVRVTPYRRVGGPVDSPVAAPPDVPGSPAAAPPPTARGWRGLGSYWIRLSVPVALDGTRLVVDVDEETLDEPLDAETPEPVAAVATDDPTLDDDSSATGGDR